NLFGPVEVRSKPSAWQRPSSLRHCSAHLRSLDRHTVPGSARSDRDRKELRVPLQLARLAHAVPGWKDPKRDDDSRDYSPACRKEHAWSRYSPPYKHLRSNRNGNNPTAHLPCEHA